MSTPESESAPPADEPAATASAPQPAEAAEFVEPEPIIEQAQREVTLQRSVRYGRILVGGALLFAFLGAISATFFPIADDALYSMGQVAGFAAVIGGAVGLMVGAVLALILNRIAARRSGTGVAIQTDVR